MTLISLWIFFFMHKEDKVYYIMLIMKCTGNTYGRERIDRREKWAEPWIASLGHKTSLIKFIHQFPVSCLVCIGIIIREIVYVCVSGREREASTYTLWALNQLIISTMCLNICAIWCVVSLQIISCCGHVCISLYVKHGKQKWLKIEQRENLYMLSYIGALSRPYH